MRPAEEPFLHPGKSAVVRDAQGRPVGWLGEVHPLVLQAYDLRAPAVAAELDLEVLLDAAAEIATFRDLLAYPAVEQDLALVVDSAVPAAAVVDSLRSAGGDFWRTSRSSICMKEPRSGKARRAWPCV